MGKPTLLVAGNLAAIPGGPPQAELDALEPIEYIVRWLRRRMPEFGARPADPARGWSALDRVLVVQAQTGAGKSTVMPAYVLRLVRGEAAGVAAARSGKRAAQFAGAGVLCTQPRILTAKTLALEADRDNANYPDFVLGQSVGYMTGDETVAPIGGLAYSTIGVLTARLKRALASAEEAAAFFGAYRFIIIDEVHERSIDLDLALASCKALLLEYEGDPRLPFVILASATFDRAKVAAYFGVPAANEVFVTGATFPVSTHYAPVGTNDYPAAAAETALRIHRENAADPPGVADILVFLPGAGEMRLTREVLEAAAADAGADAGERGYEVFTIDGEEVKEGGRAYHQLTAGAAPSGPRGRLPPRRIILSTAVAETGLTVPSLGYVVDSGWSRQAEYYPAHDCSGLVDKPTPLSRATQRKGRAGRKQPGAYFPLYTQNVASALPPQQFPDIVTSDLGGAVLDLFRLQAAAGDRAARKGARKGGAIAATKFVAGNTDLLTPPPAEMLWGAIERAYVLGFVSEAAPLIPQSGGLPLAALAAVAIRASSPPAAAIEPGIDLAAAPVHERGWGLTPMGELARRLSGQSFGSLETLRLVLGGIALGACLFDVATIAAMFEVMIGRLITPLPGQRPSRDKRLPPVTLQNALPEYLLRRRVFGAAASVAPEDTADAVADTVDPDVDETDPDVDETDPDVDETDPDADTADPDDERPPDPYDDIDYDPLETGLTREDETLFRSRLALGDDFLEHLLVFDTWRDAVVGVKIDGDPTKARALAAESRLDYKTLLTWGEARERILSALVTAGINVFDPEIGRPEEALRRAKPREWLPRVARLKRVLYDALRHRTLTYDAANDVYRNRAGVTVAVPPSFVDAELRRLDLAPEFKGMPHTELKPRRVVTNAITYARDRNPRARQIVYKGQAGLVCVLDGFVPTDPAFCGDA